MWPGAEPPLVPKNNDESCSKMIHRVLDTAQRIVIHQITSRTNHKEISDALIKNDFGCRPRISATDDDGKWMLVLRGFRATGGDGLAGAHFALSEALVAGLQAAESLVGCNGLGCRISGHRPADEGDRHH